MLYINSVGRQVLLTLPEEGALPEPNGGMGKSETTVLTFFLKLSRDD